MKCSVCDAYIPDGLGLKKCLSCDAPVELDIQPIQSSESNKNCHKEAVKSASPIPTHSGINNNSVKSLFFTFYFLVLLAVLLTLYRPGILSSFLFWFLTLNVVRVSCVLKNDKSTKGSEVFLTGAHLCLSYLLDRLGQLCVPIYLIICSDKIRSKNYIANYPSSAFSSSKLLALPVFAFLDYGHALIIATTPSKGYVLLDKLGVWGSLFLYPSYSSKLVIAIGLALFFASKYFSVKKVIPGSVAIFMMVSLGFLHFQALPFYKKIAYKLIEAKLDKQTTDSILADYSTAHVLGKEIIINYLRKKRMREIHAMIHGGNEPSNAALFGAVSFMAESGEFLSLYWAYFLKIAIGRQLFGTLQFGVNALNRIGNVDALKTLDELELFARKDERFIDSLKLLEENRRIKNGLAPVKDERKKQPSTISSQLNLANRFKHVKVPKVNLAGPIEALATFMDSKYLRNAPVYLQCLDESYFINAGLKPDLLELEMKKRYRFQKCRVRLVLVH